MHNADKEENPLESVSSSFVQLWKGFQRHNFYETESFAIKICFW